MRGAISLKRDHNWSNTNHTTLFDETTKWRDMSQKSLYLRSIVTNGTLVDIDDSLVCSRVQQTLQLGGIVNLKLRDPSRALRILVDSLGLVIQECIPLHDFSTHGREHIRGRLDRLHSPNGLACADFRVCSGKFDKDDITQRVSSVIRDSNLGCMSRVKASGLVACLP